MWPIFAFFTPIILIAHQPENHTIPSLIVTSPGINSTFSTDSNLHIAWNASLPFKDISFTLNLVKNDALQEHAITTPIKAGLNNTTDFSWTIPQTIPAGEYRVNVTAYYAITNAIAASNCSVGFFIGTVPDGSHAPTGDMSDSMRENIILPTIDDNTTDVSSDSDGPLKHQHHSEFPSLLFLSLLSCLLVLLHAFRSRLRIWFHHYTGFSKDLQEYSLHKKWPAETAIFRICIHQNIWHTPLLAVLLHSMDDQEIRSSYIMHTASTTGTTTLIRASSRGNKITAKILLHYLNQSRKKAFILFQQQDKKGRTALMYACGSGYTRMASFLLDSLDPETRRAYILMPDHEGNTALSNTCMYGFYGHPAAAKLLLARLETQADKQAAIVHENNEGRTPLMLACAQINNCQKIGTLLLETLQDPRKEKAYVLQQDKAGWTALMYACLLDRLENIQFLTQLRLREQYSDIML